MFAVYPSTLHPNRLPARGPRPPCELLQIKMGERERKEQQTCNIILSLLTSHLQSFPELPAPQSNSGPLHTLH